MLKSAKPVFIFISLLLAIKTVTIKKSHLIIMIEKNNT